MDIFLAHHSDLPLQLEFHRQQPSPDRRLGAVFMIRKLNTSVLVLLLVVGLLVVFFYPKRSGYSAIVGQQFMTCTCVGVEKRFAVGDVKGATCYGLPLFCVRQTGFR